MNYTALILRFLILLLLPISNSYAVIWGGWYLCGPEGRWWCYAPPSCVDQTEVRSQSCPVHQSGAIQEVRYYSCNTQSWTAWQQSSNNCTQDAPSCTYSAITEQRSCGQNEIGYKIYKREQNCPDPYGSFVDSGWFEISSSCQPAPATCHTITETRNESCLPGYEGVITQSKTSSCSTPYSIPMFSDWITVSNTCKMTLANQTNVLSPVSIVSPINPTSVLATPVSPTVTESAIAPMANVQTTTLTPEIKSETKTETKTEEPKVKEIIPGLGLVLSVGMLTKSGLDVTQPSMADSYNLEQENEYGFQQGVFMGFIIETNIYDSFNAYSSRRNANLLRNYNFQQNAFGN